MTSFISAVSRRALIAMAFSLVCLSGANAQELETDPPSRPSTNCRGWEFCTPGVFVIDTPNGLFQGPCLPSYLSVSILSFGEKYHYDLALDCGLAKFGDLVLGSSLCSGSTHRKLDPCDSPGL